jgi:signal transduction histidine kinase
MTQQGQGNEPPKPRRFGRNKLSSSRRIRSGMRFRQTLLSRYMFIILFAFCFVPIIFPVSSVLYIIIGSHMDKPSDYLKYGNSSQMETMWHREASKLSPANPEAIELRLHELKQSYPEASIFWVNQEGALRLQLPVQEQLPLKWSATDAIQFMKTHVNGDPFTVVAFIGDPAAGPSGFMTLQLPRSIIEISRPIGTDTPYYIAFIFLMFVFFIALSLLFFRSIRRRLLRLQAAMAIQSENGLPVPIVVTRQDEIGQLEESFNQMIGQLVASREREQAETELRKQLIANLSHDLRTPLTIMNSHIYTLRNEPLSASAKIAIGQIEHKISSIDGLMDNLLAYTLMTSGRYPLKLEPVDMLRLVRESAAAWYPLWEQAGIVPDIELPEEPVLWMLDKQGFRRVLDNLFQNIVRHAQEGQYIGISTICSDAREQFEGGADIRQPSLPATNTRKLDEQASLKDGSRRHNRVMLVISDRGPGIASGKGGQGADSASGKSGKGAGIGLAIVDYLVQEMGLVSEISSSEHGTRFLLYPKAR